MTVSVVEPLFKLAGDEVTAATSIPRRAIDRRPTMVLMISSRQEQILDRGQQAKERRYCGDACIEGKEGQPSISMTVEANVARDSTYLYTVC